jgi:hypothetical protein
MRSGQSFFCEGRCAPAEQPILEFGPQLGAGPRIVAHIGNDVYNRAPADQLRGPHRFF